jgi:hypothetical protein
LKQALKLLLDAFQITTTTDSVIADKNPVDVNEKWVT